MEGSGNRDVITVKKPKRRILKVIAGVLVLLLLILIVGVVFAVPAYVSSESCRRLILAKAKEAGVGSIDFADLSMSWGRGISVSGVKLRDSAESISVDVKGFSTRPRYGSLLTGNLAFGETVINEPRIVIDLGKMKQKEEGREQKAEGKRQEARAGIPVQRIDLVLKDGGVRIKGVEGVVEVSQINSRVNLRGEGERTEFEIGASVAGVGEGSTISAKGEVKPGKGWDLKRTSGDVAIEVNNLSLSQLESILAIAGIDISARGLITANLKGEMKNGVIGNIDADVKGSGLEITAPQLKGDNIKTSVLDAEIEAHQEGDLMSVEKMAVRTDWLRAEAEGTAPMSLASAGEFMKADSKYEFKASVECDLPAVAGQLPKTLGLKEGMRITGGKLAGSVQTLTGAGAKRVSGQASIEGLAGMVEGKAVVISEPIRAEALIAADGKEVKFEKAEVTSAFARLSCTGTFESFGYEAQADLARVAGELGQFADLGRYGLGGQFTSKGQISNTKSTTMIAAQSSVDDFRVSPTADMTITEPKAEVAITAAVDKEKQVFLVKELKVDAGLGQFSVKDGRFPMRKDTKEGMSFAASARGVELAKVQPYLAMSKKISKDVQLGGVAEGDVTVSFKQGSYKIATEAAKIAKLLVKVPGKEPFTQEEVRLALDAEANPAFKRAKLELTSPDIKMKGTFEEKVEGQTASMQGDAQLDYDWKAVSGMLSAFMPSGLELEGKRKDTISFSSRYPAGKTEEILSNLNTQAKVGFDRAGYMGLNVGATDVDIKVDKGLLTISPFTTTANNGRLSFGGSADFKEKPAMFRTPGPMYMVKDVQVNDETANKLLARINPVFSGALSVSGDVNLDCNEMAVPIRGGRSEDVYIMGTISLSGAKMQPTGLLGAILAATGAGRGETITIHPTPFVVKNGFVRYANMQMDIGRTPINFSGSVPLDPDRQIEEFRVTLPITAKGERIKVGEETGERKVSAYVKGTPRRPELDLGRVVQEQLIQTGLELLLEKTKKK
jgi:hypothetical protein